MTSAQLWEQVDAFMSGSVEKKIGGGKNGAQNNWIKYIPYPILCKSHTVDKLNKSNTDVLSRLENSVSLREAFGSINPALTPFSCGKIAIVKSGISALLKLVTYDKSENSYSLADVLDYIVKKEGNVKDLSLYRQRIFAKLGYSAASILQALSLFQMLPTETKMDNLLVEACKLNIECEFLITELQALTYFTHKITLPPAKRFVTNCI